jgi:adenine/guanine phosphoribosyltransferase-like PRPP-binding protein
MQEQLELKEQPKVPPDQIPFFDLLSAEAKDRLVQEALKIGEALERRKDDKTDAVSDRR